ncbi:TatD family deoxyribonuclease, partial [Xanthomonas oryzae pv. oryzae]
MQLIDSHCHLDAGEFDHDRATVIARAQAAGVIQQVLPAITAASWPGLRAVSTQAPGLYPAYGLHPLFLDQHRPEHLELLAAWIERERPCAIGECGLDFFVDGLDAQAQRDYFDGQLQLAKRFDLPLIVHARRATEEVIARIKAVGGLRGVVHSFAGS